MCSGSLAQRGEPQPAGGSALLTKWLAKQPANKARRSHHRRRRLQPPGTSPTWCLPACNCRRRAQSRVSIERRTKPSAGQLGKCSPGHVPGSPASPTRPPEEGLFYLSRLQPEVQSECGEGAVSRGGFRVLSRVAGKEGTTLPSPPCAELEPAGSLCVTAAGWS